MTVSFECDSCQKVIKAPDQYAGRKAKCPACAAIVKVPAASAATALPRTSTTAPSSIRRAPKPPPEPNEQTNDASEAIAAPPPPRKKTVVPGNPRPSPEPPPEEEELDETAEGRQEEMEETAEELEEVGDDEDGAPKKKRVKRSATRHRKKKRSILLPLLAVMGGLLFFLVLGGGVAAVWWYFSPAGAGDDLRFMPDNCQVIYQARVDQMLTSDACNRLKAEIPQLNTTLAAAGEQNLGLSPGNVDTVFAGGATPVDGTVVITTKVPLKLEDLQAGLKKMAPGAAVNQSKVGRLTLYDAGARGFTLLDERRVVVGNTQTLRTVLQRDKGPNLSAELRNAMNLTDFSATIAMAMDAKAVRGKPGVVNGGLGGPFAPSPAMTQNFDRIDAVAAMVRVNSDVEVTLTAVCQDPKAAEDLRKIADGGLTAAKQNKTMPPEVADLLDISLSVSGSNVTASKTVQVAPLINLVKKQQSLVGR